jgi:dihydroorotase
MNRRQFISTATGAAAFVRIPDVLSAAAKYDLIIKGGRVIDPSRKLDAIRDVAIAQGRIAAIGVNIPPGAAETIDATGKLVVPGLIDIHTHAARVKDGPALCLADGVTGWIDAGSQGADRIGETVAVAKSAPQQCRVLINIGRAGILPEGDTMDISHADVGAARDAIARNRDMIGRISSSVARKQNDDIRASVCPVDRRPCAPRTAAE